MSNVLLFILISALIVWHTIRSDLKIQTLTKIIVKKNEEIQRLKREIEELEIDPISHALQREAWNKRVREQAKKEDQMICVLDLNDFKAINDTYGHETGDKVLRIFAETIDSNLEEGDLLGRYGGGDEFLIALRINPSTQEDLLAKIDTFFNQIRIEYEANINAYFLTKVGRTPISTLGFSYGIDLMQKQRRDIEQHVARADKNMYEQKEKKGFSKNNPGSNKTKNPPRRVFLMFGLF